MRGWRWISWFGVVAILAFPWVWVGFSGSALPEPAPWCQELGITPPSWGEGLPFDYRDADNLFLFRWTHRVLFRWGRGFHLAGWVTPLLALGTVGFGVLGARRWGRGSLSVPAVGLAACLGLAVCSPGLASTWLLGERFRVLVPPLMLMGSLAILPGAGFRLRLVVVMVIVGAAPTFDIAGSRVWLGLWPAVVLAAREAGRSPWIAGLLWGLFGQLVTTLARFEGVDVPGLSVFAESSGWDRVRDAALLALPTGWPPQVGTWALVCAGLVVLVALTRVLAHRYSDRRAAYGFVPLGCWLLFSASGALQVGWRTARFGSVAAYGPCDPALLSLLPWAVLCLGAAGPRSAARWTGLAAVLGAGLWWGQYSRLTEAYDTLMAEQAVLRCESHATVSAVGARLATFAHPTELVSLREHDRVQGLEPIELVPREGEISGRVWVEGEFLVVSVTPGGLWEPGPDGVAFLATHGDVAGWYVAALPKRESGERRLTFHQDLLPEGSRAQGFGVFAREGVLRKLGPPYEKTGGQLREAKP